MSVRHNSKNIVNDAIIKDIADAVGSLDYGTVTIKVHETKIIQIEVTEKTRLTMSGALKEVVAFRYIREADKRFYQTTGESHKSKS